jgi:hypothetical protein
LLPILVLAVPILDTTLVTIVRLLDGRPVTQGGRDHTSHRLVYQGLSDKRAVVLLCVVSAALGLTSLAYEVLNDRSITLAGVLITFAFLLQFGSYLADEREPERGSSFIRSLSFCRRSSRPSWTSTLISLVPIVIISAQGQVRGGGTCSTSAAGDSCRATSSCSGLCRGLWRYAGANGPASRVVALEALRSRFRRP